MSLLPNIPIKGEGIQCSELPSLTVRECVGRRLSVAACLKMQGVGRKREDGLQKEEV